MGWTGFKYCSEFHHLEGLVGKSYQQYLKKLGKNHCWININKIFNDINSFVDCIVAYLFIWKSCWSIPFTGQYAGFTLQKQCNQLFEIFPRKKVDFYLRNTVQNWKLITIACFRHTFGVKERKLANLPAFFTPRRKAIGDAMLKRKEENR